MLPHIANTCVPVTWVTASGASKCRCRAHSRLIAVIAVGLFLSACAQPQPSFNESRAYSDLERQVAFGPRIPGTAGHQSCLDWMASELKSSGASVTKQEFIGHLPGITDSVRMTNLIARFGDDDDRILLSAHWDTRHFADLDPDSSKRAFPVPGGNDGASGVAVLLELARAFDSVPPPIGIDIVLFDGEDSGDYGSQPGAWCQGSFYFTAHMDTRYKWAINIDMVGDKNLALHMEGHSLRLAPDLVERVWQKAEDLNEPAFIRIRGNDIFDDHMPLLMRGIPAIDIIDLDYPPWHTTSDTPDRCSAASLGSVGRVLLAVVYGL